MSGEVQREMTLDEYVGVLPERHRARREYDALFDGPKGAWPESEIRYAINEALDKVWCLWVWPLTASKRFYVQQAVMRSLREQESSHQGKLP